MRTAIIIIPGAFIAFSAITAYILARVGIFGYATIDQEPKLGWFYNSYSKQGVSHKTFRPLKY